MSKNSIKNLSVNVLRIIECIITCAFNAFGIVLMLLFFSKLRKGTPIENNFINVLSVFIVMELIITFFHKAMKHIMNMRANNGGKVIPNEHIVRRINEDEIIKNKKVISIHEAGHVVTALIVGLRVLNVEILVDEQGLARGNTKSIIDNPSADTDNAEYFTKLIVNYYAGAMAEKLFFGKISMGNSGKDDSDFVMAEKLIKQMLLLSFNDYDGFVEYGHKFEEAVYDVSRRLAKEASEIVTDKINIVERLSEKLMTKGKLEEKEILEIVNIS
ncbi:MAG: hypothetical protein UCH84_03100 [Eubacterium sp.]|nr:hypothetical protein [Eubacterium sp.]